MPVGDVMNVELQVEGMSCEHCVRAVERAVAAVAPGARVTVELASGRVRVDNGTDPDRIAAAIREAGYEVREMKMKAGGS